MKAYVSVFRIKLINGLQYRVAALAGIATQFFWGFMYIMIYEAFYSSSSAASPMTLKSLIVYIWLQQSFLVFIMLWQRDGELFSMITGGNIAYELCRPCALYGFWYARLLAQRVSGALLRLLPILLVAFLLPEPYKMALPPHGVIVPLFLLSLLLGLFLVVSISMLIYISVFYTLSPVGSMLMISITGDFLSGLLIPVPLMPQWLQTITYILPFRYTADLPFRVYTGNIAPYEAIIQIFIQLIWLLVLVTLGQVLMNKALKRVVVQGG